MYVISVTHLLSGSFAVILIDFWTPWCGPCHTVGPLIEQLDQQFAGQVRIGNLHVDEQPAIAARYRITSIPTVAIFRQGKVIHTLSEADILGRAVEVERVGSSRYSYK